MKVGLTVPTNIRRKALTFWSIFIPLWDTIRIIHFQTENYPHSSTWICAHRARGRPRRAESNSQVLTENEVEEIGVETRIFPAKIS
jgi:hypothetical protein